jgi:hypothetical protein
MSNRGGGSLLGPRSSIHEGRPARDPRAIIHGFRLLPDERSTSRAIYVENTRRRLHIGTNTSADGRIRHSVSSASCATRHPNQ